MMKTVPFHGTARFQVRRCLGAGGFGAVYEAFERKRNALVAVKVLRDASPDDLYRLNRSSARGAASPTAIWSPSTSCAPKRIVGFLPYYRLTTARPMMPDSVRPGS